MPRCNAAGLDIIRQDEGLLLRAYPDPASPYAQNGSGPGDPWTIGFGHTANVHPGETCTEAQALAFLAEDVRETEVAIAEMVEVVLTPNQFSALVSFQYNTGAFAASTMRKLINQKDFAGAQNQFGLWVWAQGLRLAGLVRRRAQEAALFATPGG